MLCWRAVKRHRRYNNHQFGLWRTIATEVRISKGAIDGYSPATLLSSVIQVDEVCDRGRIIPQILRCELLRVALTVEQRGEMMTWMVWLVTGKPELFGEKFWLMVGRWSRLDGSPAPSLTVIYKLNLDSWTDITRTERCMVTLKDCSRIAHHRIPLNIMSYPARKCQSFEYDCDRLEVYCIPGFIPGSGIPGLQSLILQIVLDISFSYYIST